MNMISYTECMHLCKELNQSEFKYTNPKPSIWSWKSPLPNENWLNSEAILINLKSETNIWLSGMEVTKCLSEFKANLRNIFVSPYPTLFNRYGSVGRKIILFYFPNSIPIKLIVNSPTLGNNIKYTNNLQLTIFFKYNAAVYIGQFFKLANCQWILKKIILDWKLK